MTFLLQAIVTFFLTVVAGNWLSGRWQERNARQQRYHEALKSRYDRIDHTIQKFTSLAGTRIYRTQRLVLNYPDKDGLEAALADLSVSIKEWNEAMMAVEVNVQSHFKKSKRVSLESIEGSFSSVTNALLRQIRLNRLDKATALEEIGILRHQCFGFIRGMVEEAKTLDREMHFGVRVAYDSSEIRNWKTSDLFKALFLDLKQADSVVRPPSDFGSPVSIGETRFGVDQH